MYSLLLGFVDLDVSTFALCIAGMTFERRASAFMRLKFWLEHQHSTNTPHVSFESSVSELGRGFMLLPSLETFGLHFGRGRCRASCGRRYL